MKRASWVSRVFTMPTPPSNSKAQHARQLCGVSFSVKKATKGESKERGWLSLIFDGIARRYAQELMSNFVLLVANHLDDKLTTLCALRKESAASLAETTGSFKWI
jgi:hypothetical protein